MSAAATHAKNGVDEAAIIDNHQNGKGELIQQGLRWYGFEGFGRNRQIFEEGFQIPQVLTIQSKNLVI